MAFRVWVGGGGTSILGFVYGKKSLFSNFILSLLVSSTWFEKTPLDTLLIFVVDKLIGASNVGSPCGTRRFSTESVAHKKTPTASLPPDHR